MIDRRWIKNLRKIVGKYNVLTDKADLLTYGYDSYVDEAMPDAVVLPCSTEEVAEVVRRCHREGVPFIPRGAGTSLSGGVVPVAGGVVLALSRMNRILDLDIPNRRSVVQPGVLNFDLKDALREYGYTFLPDPSSQAVSTLGGNVSENAGGPMCLKYGVTTNHILGLTVVLPDGRIVRFDGPGYDLVGLFVGSEGTLGIATEITVRIAHLPEAARTLLAAFETVEDAAGAVTEIVASGIIPAALELMDRTTIEAVEASVHAGYPPDAGAVLVIEVDGSVAGLDTTAERIGALCRGHRATDVQTARDDEERALLWRGRRGMGSAIARLRPTYLVADGTVPRTLLPEALRRVGELAHKYDLVIPIVAHAGDGNLHPALMFDERTPGEKERAFQAGEEVMRLCVELGGTITGEHGIGTEKIDAMTLMFTPEELRAMRLVKHAFDPTEISNPAKMLPEENVPAASIAREHDVPTEDMLREVQRIAGPDGICTDPKALDAFEIDGHIPAGVVSPAEPDHIPEILAAASGLDAALVPWGGGTKIAMGHPIQRAEWVLCTAQLNQIIEHDAENMTATVSAGIRLSDLQETLRERGQFVPLDPPFSSRATVGGLISTDAAGPRALRYGTARDLVLGTRVVLPNGDLIRTGGRTMKNVAGYDMTKLFIGSFGTLGVVTEVTFRTFALPEATAASAFAHPSVEDAWTFTQSLLDAPVTPSVLDLLSPDAMDTLAPHLDQALPPQWVSVVAFEGGTEEVDAGKARARKEAGTGGLPLTPPGELRDHLQETSPDEAWIARWAAALPPATMLQALDALQRLGSRNILCRPGTGRLFGSLRCGDVHELIETLSALSGSILDLGGHLTLESAPLEIRLQLDFENLVGDAGPVMQALKHAFDPAGILNPGKFGQF